MRLYFHLKNDFDEVPDQTGLELPELYDLPLQVLGALEAISKEDPQLLQEGTGWHVDIADTLGNVLFSVALGQAGEVNN
jgi:hypothetical protein